MKSLKTLERKFCTADSPEEIFKFLATKWD